MVFLSGVDDITGMPISQAVPARIAKPVRASIRKAVKARIAKQVKARIAKPVPARILQPWYAEGSEGQGTSGYHLSGFGDVDEITGIQIDAGVPATIAKPTPPSILPGPSGAIQSAVPIVVTDFRCVAASSPFKSRVQLPFCPRFRFRALAKRQRLSRPRQSSAVLPVRLSR